jgi:hypothetical protein
MPIAWANIRLFDRNERMITGPIKLNLWPFTQHIAGQFNPMGQNGTNSDWNSIRVELELANFTDARVVYPSISLMTLIARRVRYHEADDAPIVAQVRARTLQCYICARVCSTSVSRNWNCLSTSVVSTATAG